MKNTLDQLTELGFITQDFRKEDEVVTFYYQSPSLTIDVECEMTVRTKNNEFTMTVGAVKEAYYKVNNIECELHSLNGKRINTNRLAAIIAAHDCDSPLFERELKETA